MNGGDGMKSEKHNTGRTRRDERITTQHDHRHATDGHQARRASGQATAQASAASIRPEVRGAGGRER